MVKRYSKRAYRKRTQRKSRSNRRRRTQKGGQGFGNFGNFGMFSKAKEAATGAVKSRLGSGPDSLFVQGIGLLNKTKEATTNALANTPIGQKIIEFKNMSFQDQLLATFGTTMELFVSFSKMVMSLLVYVYIAKVMISNPGAAREMFESKKEELKGQHPRVFECINKALETAKSPTVTPQIPADAPPKSLVETLVERKDELRKANDKIAFMKDLITDKINKMNQDIERIKTNSELRDCFEEASSSVNAKKVELMNKIQADEQISAIIKNIIAAIDALKSKGSEMLGQARNIVAPSPMSFGTRVLGSGATTSFTSTHVR